MLAATAVNYPPLKTYMNTKQIIGRIWLVAVLMTLALATTQAQTTATWIGPASGGEWNATANWDTGAPPLDSTTNAVIGVGTNVNYNVAMTANPFGTLQVKGILNVNTTGFNSSAVTMTNNASRWFINNGGVASVTGGISLFSNAVVAVATGGSLTASGTLTFGASVTGTAFGIVTNSGGTLTVAGVGINPNNASIGTSSKFVITGGINNLGAVSSQRSPGGNSAPPALGTDGLIISNGQVNATSISVGNNAHGIIYQLGGTLTNAGTFTLRNTTGTRPARFLQVGGLLVQTNGNVILNASGGGDTVYSILGGTNTVNGIQIGTAANTGTCFVTNAASIFIGGAGIFTNGVITSTVLLNSNGRFGAITDWTNTSPITLNGGTFDAQDAGGTPHNIYSTGVLKTGALIKNGGGTLTLTATNTPSSTTVNAGTLAFAIDAGGSAGSVGSSITVATNATLDVSGLNSLGGFSLASGRSLAGGGTVTGNFIAGGGSFINPAGTGSQGGMAFGTGLAATNANFNFELTDDPTGTIKRNDAISITGDLNTGGVNPIAVTAVGSLGIGTYTLIGFTGTFNGDVSNFSCSAGAITNPPGSGKINLVVTSVRPVANLVWRGDGAGNQWDTAVTVDWLNGVALDRSYTGDTNTFNDTATNFTVNIFGNVTPASASTVLVNATNDYTFTGSGSIAGATSLTKTNSGKLTLVGTNFFSGGVNVKGGTVSVASLADDGTPNPLGQTGTILVDGGTLEYTGPNSAWTRNLTVGVSNATISSANTLTHSGTIVGSGALIVTATGGLTLNNANSYSGGTILNSGTLTLNSSVSGNTLTLSWPADHIGWRLQAQTNTLGSGLGTNWTDILGTDTSNTYNVTLNPANGTVFYRMVYP